MLEFDETLEVLELSTGKPKTDQNLFRTVYLQTENNIVSDIIDAETKDLVDVKIRLSYRVNFTGDNKKWFSVANYVKLMTQHLRSIVRNRVKKINIEEFNNDAADILRDTILGQADEGKKRPGKIFTENGMQVYDIEVLGISIGDDDISFYLKDFQKHVVKKNMEINKLKKEFDNTKEEERIKREILNEKFKTDKISADILLQKRIESNKLDMLDVNSKKEKQLIVDEINNMLLEYNKIKDAHEIEVDKEKSNIRILEYEKQMGAIQPKLIEAMITLGGVKTTQILAENLKQQGGDWTDVFRKGGIDGFLDTIKGTPMYDNVVSIFKQITPKSEE